MSAQAESIARDVLAQTPQSNDVSPLALSSATSQADLAASVPRSMSNVSAALAKVGAGEAVTDEQAETLIKAQISLLASASSLVSALSATTADSESVVDVDELQDADKPVTALNTAIPKDMSSVAVDLSEVAGGAEEEDATDDVVEEAVHVDAPEEVVAATDEHEDAAPVDHEETAPAIEDATEDAVPAIEDATEDAVAATEDHEDATENLADLTYEEPAEEALPEHEEAPAEEEEEVLGQVELLRRKIEVVRWMHQWLKQDGIMLIDMPEENQEAAIYALDVYEHLKSGAILCRMLNNIMLSNPSFVEQNLPTIAINERTDLFAQVSNLSNFVRTCELYFNVDRFRLFEPATILKEKSEAQFLSALHFLKLVLEQTSTAFPVLTAKPFIPITFDQLSTLITMITTKAENPVVAYDPRVVMSVQDVEVFQRLVGKIDSMEISNKNLSVMTSTLVNRFEKMESGQQEIKHKLESLVAGILGAFEDVTNKLRDLKDVTDVVGASAKGLQVIVNKLETDKSLQRSSTSGGSPGTRDQLKIRTDNEAIVKAPSTGKLSRAPTSLSPNSPQLRTSLADEQLVRKSVNSLKAVTQPAPQSPVKTEAPSLGPSPSRTVDPSPVDSPVKSAGPSPGQSPLKSAGPSPGQSVQNSPRTSIHAFSMTAPGAHSASQSPTNTAGPNLGGKVFKLPKEVLDMNLPKEENMRQSVLYEVMDSEADYVRDLNVMILGHKRELRERKILDEAQIKTMFSNLEDLLPVNQKLLALVVARRDENPVIDGLGDLFLEMGDAFMVYDEYCANYPMANSLLKEIKNREDMKAYLEKANLNPNNRGLSLESFLIKPVQRICKYPLLLRELIKHTPAGHKDKPFLEKAMSKIEEVVTLVNEKTRAVGDREKMIELQNRIDANPPLDFANTNGRRIIRDGPIQKFVSGKLKDRNMILFNDMIIICKQQLMNKVRPQFECSMELKSVTLNAAVNPKVIGGNASSMKMVKTMFEIVYNGESFIFNCATEIDRSKWVGLFDDALKNVPDLGPKKVAAPVEIASAANSAASSRPSSAQQHEPIKSTSSVNSFTSSLKKSNTLSMKKRPTLWGRKKTSSQEDLAETAEVEPQAATFDKTPIKIDAPLFAFAPKKTSLPKSHPENPVLIEEPVAAAPVVDDGGMVERRVKDYNTEVTKRGSIVEALISLPAAPATSPPPGIFIPQTADVEGFPTWKAVDAGNGSVYYFNQETNETSWYHPSILQMQRAQQQPAPDTTQLSPEDMQRLYQEKLDSMAKLQQQLVMLNQGSSVSLSPSQ